MPTTPTYDTWGALQIPNAAQTAPPYGDPVLAVILNYLQAYVSTDGNATAAWAQVYPSSGPIANVYTHNPTEVIFYNTTLPALYMWRESAAQEWIADEWLRETTVVRAVWVFPNLGAQEDQRVRSPFVNALVKTIGDAIQRSRTPSYVYPGDPDPTSATLGSWWYALAGFDKFILNTWKTSPIVLPTSDGPSIAYPAIELTFEMWETLNIGLGKYSPQTQIQASFVAPDQGTGLGPLDVGDQIYT